MRFLLFILSIIPFLNVFGKCADSGMRAYPCSKAIASNSQILIEGWANSITVLKHLNTKHDIFLVSKNHKVKLTVVKVLESEFNHIEVFLKAIKPLKAGNVYTLHIENTDEQPQKLIWETLEETDASWVISGEMDNSAPIIRQTELIKSKIMLAGCGTPTHALFSIDTDDNGNVLFYTELTEIESNQTQVYYLSHQPHNTQSNHLIYVGRGMCSGEFNIKSDKKYRVRFKAVDFSGNTNEIWTDWFDFEVKWEY